MCKYEDKKIKPFDWSLCCWSDGSKLTWKKQDSNCFTLEIKTQRNAPASDLDGKQENEIGLFSDLSCLTKGRGKVALVVLGHPFQDNKGSLS